MEPNEKPLRTMEAASTLSEVYGRVVTRHAIYRAVRLGMPSHTNPGASRPFYYRSEILPWWGAEIAGKNVHPRPKLTGSVK